MKRKVLKIVSILLLTLMFVQNISLKTYAQEDLPLDNEEINAQSGELDIEGVITVFVDPEIQDVQDKVENLETQIDNLTTPIDDIKDIDANNLENPGGSPTTQEDISQTITDIQDVDCTIIAEVKEDLASIKQDLETVETNEGLLEKECDSSVDAAINVDNQADTIVNEVNQADTDVTNLINQMKTAESVDEVNYLYDQLSQKIDNDKLSLTQQKEVFESLVNTYTQVIDKFAGTQDVIDAALLKAENTAKNLVQKLNDLENQTGELLNTTEITTQKLADDGQDADALEAQLIANKNTNEQMWVKARNKMYILVENYYIPQFIDKDATDITFEFVRGFDNQDLNYNIVTYKDKDGNTHTFYVNYDMTNKQANAPTRYDGLGNSGKVVIYEKTIDEINADNYLRQYYNSQKLSDNKKKEYANSGKFDVFKYTENGVTTYLVRDEFEAFIDSGDIQTTDEGYIYNGNEVSEIIFNANSKVKGGNFILDELETEEYVNYLRKSNDLYQKFLTYQNKVEDVKGFVDDALEEASILKDAVVTLKENKSSMLITSVLSEDELTKLASIMSADEYANLETMTVKDATIFLNEFVEKAKQKVIGATNYYSLVKKQFNDITEQLDDIIANVTPAPITPTQETTTVNISNTTATNNVTITEAPTPLAGDNVNNFDVITIEDITPPLAGNNQITRESPARINVARRVNNEIQIDDNKTPLAFEDEAISEIEGDKVPLSDGYDATASKDYWWIALIAAVIMFLINRFMNKHFSNE